MPTKRITCPDCLKLRKHFGQNRRCAKCLPTKKSGRNGKRESIVEVDIARVCSDGFGVPWIDNQKADQIQIFSKFATAQSNLNAKPISPHAKSRQSLYRALLETDTSSPLLSHALRSLCLANLGCCTKDQALFHASQASYGNALSLLTRKVARPAQDVQQSREVVATILLLSCLTDATPIHEQDYKGWTTHIAGAENYLASCDASSFDPVHALDSSLIYNVFINSFWLALAERKVLSLDTPRWNAVNDCLAGKTSVPQSKTEKSKPCISFRSLPTILNRTDRIIEDPKQVNGWQVIELCEQLQSLRKDGEIKTPGHDPPRMVSTFQTDAFSMIIEEHVFMTCSETIWQFYEFEGAVEGAAAAFAYQMILRLIIDCTLLRIFHFSKTARELSCWRTPREVEQHAFETATQLCQTVYYFSQINDFANSRLIGLMVRLARNFFEEQGVVKEVGWCQGCLIANELRIRRMQHRFPPSLCRLGDLTPSLAAAGRYRARRLRVEAVG